MNYKIKDGFSINVGFQVDVVHIFGAIEQTNDFLRTLPATLFRSIDYKTTSAIIGALFCDAIATQTGSIVNPIEKGHPDVIPSDGKNASEAELRMYPQGLEVKCTVGNIRQGANLRAGEVRISQLTGITWQAHHREVRELLGLVWDFYDEGQTFNYPIITAAFYCDTLIPDDWGKISGTTGRSTKVSGMKVSGKKKMGQGAVCYIDDAEYIASYKRCLSVFS